MPHQYLFDLGIFQKNKKLNREGDITGLVKVAVDVSFLIEIDYSIEAFVRGNSQIFFHFGKNPISKNLRIGPTIFDKRLLVKSPFDRVSDRNVRNFKTPVIGISSPLPELQLAHAPPHSLALSKRNSGKCMFPGGSRACPRGQFAIAYVQDPLLLIY